MLVALIAVVAGSAIGGTAYADPAAPTDYRTEITSIEPPAAGIEFRIIGGDSFVQLTVDPGVDVVVVGYSGEPYLWFRPDGTVAENQKSPSTYLNASRYGRDAPSSASADAEPEWVDVATDGSFAWYDHRAHWMLEIRPAGKSAGDQILESVIPIVVDGVDTDVTVMSTWEPSPSARPVIVGAIVGVVTAGAALLLSRRSRFWPLALAPVAVSATVVGWWQYSSLPSETDPRLLWAVLPVVALVAIGASIAAGAVWRTRRSPVAGGALVAAGALVIWAALKRDGIGAAIVPTDAPQGLDRGTVVAAFVAALGVGALAVAQFFRSPGTEEGRATT